MKTLKLLGQDYTFRACTLSDIDGHYEKIRENVTDVPEDVFKNRMQQAIENGTAFCVDDANTYLYYLHTSSKAAHGVALNNDTHPIGIMALLTYIFNCEDLVTELITFKLHAQKNIKEYKSLITRLGLKRHRQLNTALTVRVNHLRKKYMNTRILSGK